MWFVKWSDKQRAIVVVAMVTSENMIRYVSYTFQELAYQTILLIAETLFKTLLKRVYIGQNKYIASTTLLTFFEWSFSKLPVGLTQIRISRNFHKVPHSCSPESIGNKILLNYKLQCWLDLQMAWTVCKTNQLHD